MGEEGRKEWGKEKGKEMGRERKKGKRQERGRDDEGRTETVQDIDYYRPLIGSDIELRHFRCVFVQFCSN